MIQSGSYRYGQPIILKDSTTSRPQRLPFTEKHFDEGWLQDLLRVHPELLPVEEIEPAFVPLVTIGREVPTPVGPIDNLYISPQGYLCIVETKLWRNPQARREVVGQIIDYAKEIAQWTFDDLEACVRAYNEQYEQTDRGVLDTLRQVEQIDPSEEAGLVDAITRNLQRGRFLLLIVGDGIRESVEAMAEYLSQTPQLYFTLALVELQIYSLGDNDNWLVVPQIVARTREVTRAIVRIEGQNASQISVDVNEPQPQKATSKRSVLTEEDFLNTLQDNTNKKTVAFAQRILQDAEKRGYFIDWKQASFVVKMKDPTGSGQNITLFVVTKEGKLYIGWMARQLRVLGLPAQIVAQYAQETARLFGTTATEDYWNHTPTLDEIKEHYEAFLTHVDKTVQSIQAQTD